MRAAAFILIAETGKGDNRAFDTLVAAIKEKSVQVRFGAVQALALMGDARAIPVLEEAAKSKDISGNFRLLINNAINNIKNPQKTAEKNN